MGRLTDLGYKHNTDKSDHGYTEFYEPYFTKYHNPKILEIGVYTGGSVKMMEEFFGSPTIIGVDIESKTQYDSQHIKTLVADQANPKELLKVLDYEKEFDIIIDDGGHTMEQQLVSIATMFPYVKSGGIYILEDLHTSFIGGQYNPKNESFTAYDFIYRLSKKLEASSQYISEDQLAYIYENTIDVKIFQKDSHDFLHSITSVISKK